MCRGCVITKNGESSTNEYLKWKDMFDSNISAMKGVESLILKYLDGIDSEEHIRIIDSLRRKLIRARKEYAKAEFLLSKIE